MNSPSNSIRRDWKTNCQTWKCDLRGDCFIEANQRFVDDFFADDWEALVIKHDPENGDFKMDKIEGDR